MIETINGKAYLKVGDKVYELGGGSNIITADSVEQLPDPASVPERTIALVKSEGGGGLPVVELTTALAGTPTELTADECLKMDEAAAFGTPIMVKFPTVEGMVMSCVFNAMTMGEMRGFTTVALNGLVILDNSEGTWKIMINPLTQ